LSNRRFANNHLKKNKEAAVIREPDSLGEFSPFPLYRERQAWEDLAHRKPEEAEFFVSTARGLLGQEWPSLPAALFMDFQRTGNRTRFQEKCFRRRRNLFILVLAECLEGRGEYLDEIINGLWYICEESTWVIPSAHNHYPPGLPVRELPDITLPKYIQLFSAETGSVLSWVYYFLAGPIAAVAPQALNRLVFEMKDRLLAPYLEHDDYHWMGLNHDQPLNNWNPWINSNMLVSFLVFAGVFPGAHEGVNKAVRSLNRYLAMYPEDGGCDEGPGYFGKSGASLFDCIEELSHITDISYLYQNGKIRNMAAYAYKVYIAGRYYVNYADAPPVVSMPVDLLERVGRSIGDSVLVNFAAYLRKNRYFAPFSDWDNWWSLFRRLSDLFSGPGTPAGRKPAAQGSLCTAGAESPFIFPSSSWFKDIQVAAAREQPEPAASNPPGFFFSAKGGHNGESHNHNDIGNFVLYYDGLPVLVDPGVEEYTKFTFSGDRYKIWTMRSCYHNVPTVNGFDQLPGGARKAADASFADDGRTARFSLDMAGAYPPEAGLKTYRRECTLDRGKEFTLTDAWSLTELKTPLALNLLCYEAPEISKAGVLLNGLVVMEFDNTRFTPELEPVSLADAKLYKNWQKDKLYRLRLIDNRKEPEGKACLRFKPGM
jgi:hypothetical protein